MKTLNALVTELKTKNPTLRTGNEEAGYSDLSPEEYEATIAQWATNLFAAQENEAKALAAKASAEAKLVALGLTPEDLKALGL